MSACLSVKQAEQPVHFFHLHLLVHAFLCVAHQFLHGPPCVAVKQAEQPVHFFHLHLLVHAFLCVAHQFLHGPPCVAAVDGAAFSSDGEIVSALASHFARPSSSSSSSSSSPSSS